MHVFIPVPIPEYEMIVELCPVCDKKFTNEYISSTGWEMTPQNRMLMHLIMSHQDNIKINIIGDPNNINTWLVNVKTTPKEL